MIRRFHTVTVDTENTVRAGVDLVGIQEEGSKLVFKFGWITDAGCQLPVIEWKLSDIPAFLRTLDSQQTIRELIHCIPVPSGKLPVCINMHLLHCSQTDGRVIHVKEFIQGDMEQPAQTRDQIDVRPGSAVLPV